MIKKIVIKSYCITALLIQGLYADSNPTMSRLYGNQFTTQVPDSQSSAVVGSLDTIFGSSGSLTVNAIISGGQAVGLETLSNGTFLAVVAKSATNSKVALYNAQGSLQTYGTAGIADLGSATETPRATMIDPQGRLVVAGGDTSGTAGWLKRVSTDGDTITSFSTSTNWQFIGGLAQQSSGKIIAVGFNGSYAQLARYNLDGTLDTTFAASGYFILNSGTTSQASVTGLYSVIVDASDNIYTIYLDNAGSSEAHLLKLNSSGASPVYSTVTELNNATVPYTLAFNQDGNIILAAAVSNIITVTARTTAGAAVGSFTNFASTTINANNYILNNVLLSSASDGYGFIYLVGSDTTTAEMAVIRLGAHFGTLDTDFNTAGYNFFSITGASRTSSILQAIGLAPDGQLYVAGYQVNSGTTVPYVSRLNSTLYVTEIGQFPTAQEQGILDIAFGDRTEQLYAGVVNPYNGTYGPLLMQKAQDVIEIKTSSGATTGVPPVGDILVGLNGYTNISASSNMMLAWLTSEGVVDTSINSSGYLTLTNTTSSNEYLTSIVQGPSGLVSVAGYASLTDGGASTRAFLRVYSTASTSIWTSGTALWSVAQVAAGYKGVGVTFQPTSLYSFLFVDEGTGLGHILGYTISGATAAWGDTALGVINSTSYSLNMGPCYNGGLVNDAGNLMVAYKDSSDGFAKVAAFLPDGSGLVTAFGQGSPSGVSANLFGAATGIAANNIRTCFNSDGDILVAAIDSAGTSLLCTLLSGSTGDVDTNFGTTGVLTIAISGAAGLQLKDIIGMSDGTAIATLYDDATDDMMYLARITLIGALDTTFNSQGIQPGVLNFQIGDQVANYDARVTTSACVQSTAGANQGNIVISGYESVTSSDVTPMILRSFGDAGATQIMPSSIEDTGIPGTFDIAYDLFTNLGASAAKVVYTYPSGNTHQGYSLIGYDNGTTSFVARYNISTNVLDATFGGGDGIYTIAGSLSGISTLSIDSKNRIIAGGTHVGAPWALQIPENGGAGAVSFGTFPATMTSVNQILQQTSGRYIVAGNSSTPAGIVAAFQSELPTPNLLSATTLALDPTFNPLAGSGPAGGDTPASYIITGISGIYSIVLNSDDTILAAYKITGSSFLAVSKITANGSGLFTNFGIIGVLTTAITPDSQAVCRVAMSSLSAAVVVAASSGGGTQVELQRFLADGTPDATWNSDGSILTVTNVGTGGVVLSDLMETTSNQTVFLGYNTAGGNGRLFAARLNSSGTLDSTWNPFATGTDTAGVLTFSTNSVTQMNGSSITIDGKIIAGGQQSGGTSGNPIVIYVYGDNNVTQTSQAPLASAAGVLDLTIPGGSSGAAGLSLLITGVPSKVAIYGGSNTSNGAMMIASSDGADSYVTKLNANLTVGTYGTSGVATLTGKTSINDMYLVGDVNSTTLAPIFVTGATSDLMWGAKLNTDGTVAGYLASGSGMTNGNVIRQTNNGRILVAGFNVSSGAIVAFGSELSEGVYPLDTSFGNYSGTAPNYGGGVFSTGVGTPIGDMAIDSLDRIYIAYYRSNSIAVQRLLANGTALDTTFGTSGTATFTPAITVYSTSQIRLALDEANSRLVVAAQNGTGTDNIIEVCRYDLSGVAQGAVSTVTIASKVLNLSDLFIDAAQNIYVVGYNSTDHLAVTARIASTSSSTIALDTGTGGTVGYAIAGGTPGIANVDTGAMTVVTAGAYDPDKRTYLVGSDGSINSYIARLYGDIYTTEVSEAIVTATVGSIDTSLQPNNTGQIDLSDQTGWSGLAAGYKARAIVENPNNDGTSFIAFCNDTNLIVGKVNADMKPVTAFGDSGSSNGLTAAIAMAAVNSMTIDGDSNLIVAGRTSVPAQKVVSFTSTGTFNATFALTVPSTNGSVVVQQKSGRYIVGGYNGSTGLIIAYQNQSAIYSGTLPIDQTFGPAGINGYYATGVNGAIDDLCIDSNDTIYFTYRNASNVVCLGKLTANGSGLVDAQNSPATFNSGAIITTGITGVTGGNPSRIAINSAGNILVGNTRVTGLGSPAVQVELYNGTTGAIIGSTVTVYNSATPVLTKLVGSGTNFYGSIYNTTPTISVFSINNSGAMDSGFGASGITTISSGSTYQYVKAMSGLSVQADGRLVVVGYNNPSNNGTTFDPSLMRFNGYQYVAQYAQAPNRIPAGQVDTTLWPSTGAFPLNGTTSSTFNSLMSGYVVKRVYESGNGLMTFVADNEFNTVVFQMLKDLTLNTAFNTAGTAGYRSFTGTYGGTTGIYVDSVQDIYICGNYSGASWMIGVKSSGNDFVPNFSPASTLTAAYEMSQQNNTRLILAGLGATNGTLLGYTIEGVLDTTFGTAGVVDMGGAYPITDITINQNNEIIAVSNNAGTVVLQRVDATGLSISSIGVTAITTASTGSALKVVFDQDGRIVVAAATSDGYTLRSYNNDLTGTDIGSVSIAPSTGSGPFSVNNIYATNDGKITLVGSRASGQIIVARFTSGAGALTLDSSTFNASTGYYSGTIGSINQASDAIIHADNRIMVVGYNINTPNPLMARTFGYPYASYVPQGAVISGIGMLNTTFGDNGTYDLSFLTRDFTGLLADGQGKAVLPLFAGGFFIALDHINLAANSALIKTLASGELDMTYNGSGIATTYAPLGVNSILQDGAGNMMLVGTTGGAGWAQRYTSAGVLDTTFNGTGLASLGSGTQATSIVEQTLGRLVIAGMDSSGNGALFGYKALAPNGTPGTPDTTFNSTGTVPGVYSTGIANIITCVIADSYDRLIFAILHSGAVDLYRLTPTGQLDATFGTGGIVANAITSATSASSVHVAFDASGNIIVASNSSTSNRFSIAAFNNNNGGVVYAQLNIDSLTNSPSITNLVTSDDGYAFILGIQSGTNPAWIARITAAGTLDTADFNPGAVGGVAGIFQYTVGDGTTGHIYNALSVNSDGTLGMVGYENSSGAYTPTLVSIYNNEDTFQETQSQDSQPVGTNDLTFGVSSTWTSSNIGIKFFGASGNAASGQTAQAIGLYDDNNIVVAIDGNSAAGSDTSSEIMINMFDNDGVANPNFGTAGSAIALSNYDSQYVRDMVTFTTVAGVHKAILAGYVENSTLGTSDSLLLQYILTPGESGLDTTFGGFDGDPTGVAFGDGKSLFSVARQSNGRIIAAGLTQGTLTGLLLGYGANGKMDNSFGNNGYQSTNTGSTGIYTHAVDTNNNIVFAYNSSNSVQVARYLADGSALDSTFTTPTPLISTISGNTNMKVAVDSSNKVYAAGVINSGHSIMVKQYPTEGGTATLSATLADGTSSSLNIGGGGSAVYTLSRLFVDVAGNTIVVAYDSNAQKVVIVRLTTAFALDTTFNSTGYIRYEVAGGTSTQVATDAMIHPDGRILVSGSEL
ncbi:hypothetical protein KBC04_01945 [Candidatus Babeliales bacterium]|nr:hypothetical protein [Candidatus Babeliales bacterium]MBP9843829.1 hypothetical protein [Candidatus Babeliales bacterium]